MSIAETLDIIRAHGCPDITGSLKKSWSSNLFPIRRGGFGDIYQGVLNPHGEKVAIKCSRYTPPSTDEARESLKEFSRELYIWWKLRHENVIKLHGFAQFHGRVGMVSPWMANGNVMEYIGARPSVNRYCLCSQVANGLEYLHAQNIIHGDLKGVNVLVANDGAAKIADFGTGVLQGGSIRFTSTSGTSCISTRWAAPEILRGSPRSTQADVYALAMTILEIITGRVPFHEICSDLSVIIAVVQLDELPPRPPEFIEPTDD
ncbi:hypothetical protein FS749_000169 [Ceratobasidium sp. UAMH 11750]|nr:hypothetical protein FS749_000169 [Ceratobasidium sp. UAMH 11750]